MRQWIAEKLRSKAAMPNLPEFRLSGVEKWRRCERSAAIQASVGAFASLEHANSPFKKSGLLPASQARGRNDAAGRCS